MRRIQLPARRLDAGSLGFFRFGSVGEQIVLTGDAGDWHLLSKADFERLLAGELGADHPDYTALVAKGFVRQGSAPDALADRLREKKHYLRHGPHLHVLVTTLRCNQTCRYCHASRAPLAASGADMAPEVARQCVQRAFESDAPYLDIELQGGEPMAHFEALQAAVSEAHSLEDGRPLTLSVVTNFTHMDEAKAEWLIAHDVHLVTSLDGPADLHDANRLWRPKSSGVSTQAEVVRWIRYFQRRYQQLGRDPNVWRVEALFTTTRRALDRAEEIVDTYLALGLSTLHLRPINPYGFAGPAWRLVGYPLDAFLRFYETALDCIIARNLAGQPLVEGTAALILGKMLNRADPNYPDLRSPCGAGTGQISYGHDGRVHPCDEARLLARMGDDSFVLGEVGSSTMATLRQHPTVKTLHLASLQESLPGCSNCWNLPFCGVCPIHDYRTTGGLVAQRPRSGPCQTQLAQSTLLLERMANPQLRAVFEEWARPTTSISCRL